jgi:hypothetical protein
MRPIDYAAQTHRRCSTCKEVKPVSEFNRYEDAAAPLTGWRYYSRCRPCQSRACREYGSGNKPRRNARLRKWRRENPSAAKQADRRKRLRQYQLTEAEHAALFAKYDGMCWICRARAATAVDHDHETGRVRGALCAGCNTIVVPRAERDHEFLARAAAYLDCHADVLLELANADG